MAKKTSIIVTGNKEMDKTLHALEKRTQNVLVRGSMRETSKKTIEPAAKANAPEGETGDLKKLLKTRSSKRSRSKANKGVISVEVQVGDKEFNNYYPKFVESGTETGIEAVRYKQKAYDTQAERAKQIVTSELAAQITKEASKKNSKGAK